MKVQGQLISFVLFAALAIQQGAAQASNSTADTGARIQCYSCSSFLEEQNCNSPDEKTPVVTCEANEQMCRKVEQHITIEGSDKVRTYRSCARTGDLGECKERTGTNNFKSWYCQCKGNKCNGAGTSAVSITLLAGMLAVFCGLRSRV